MLVAANGLPNARTFLLILAALVSARSAAMIFNRLADWKIDQLNPRTAQRHQLVNRTTATIILLLCIFVFALSAAALNPLCFALSPVALILVFFYSITKRFTDFTQFFLGLALGVAPIGAWLAVTGSWALTPFVLATGVILWVAGFDIIYATLDHEFDSQIGLHSLVVRWGIAKSLKRAELLHYIAFAFLIAFGIVANLGWIYFGCIALILVAFVYEHRSAATQDPAAINRAFFQSNAVVSILFLAGVFLDRWFQFAR